MRDILKQCVTQSATIIEYLSLNHLHNTNNPNNPPDSPDNPSISSGVAEMEGKSEENQRKEREYENQRAELLEMRQERSDLLRDREVYI